MKQLTTKNKLKIINKLKIMCWSALILAFLLKILGVYYIDKGLNVDWLINLDNFVSKHKIIEESLNYLSDLFISFVLVLSINKKKKLTNKQNALLFAISTTFYIGKCLSPVLGFILDVTMIIFIPLLFKDKNVSKTKTFIRAICGFGLMNLFQILSMLVRLDDLHILNDNYVFNLVMLIDYYIMFILYYLYSTQKKE